ncbi:MAG: hypothetical protein J7M03_01100 [Candidatus Desulfofervidaceae bacterium]|nr:hypothetical protein [Candidatus Desulfofervidaceae bacterium]MDL1970927.1 hypothetical protein [Candidatus Desulfofervidaceae bacterium]
MPALAKIFDDRKYMWDGEVYETKEEAQTVVEKYQQDGFETKIVEEEGKFLVYNRREVETQ